MKYYVVENNYRIAMSTLQRFVDAVKNSSKYVKIDKEKRTILIGRSADDFDIFYFKSRPEVDENVIDGMIIYGHAFEMILKGITESIHEENINK